MSTVELKSLSAVFAKVQDHRDPRGVRDWQIENCIFFIKDRWWDEDRHWTIRPGVSEWLAQMTTAALTVLRVMGPPHLPIRGRADQIAWKPRLGLELLDLT